jgi:hypothetical protein
VVALRIARDAHLGEPPVQLAQQRRGVQEGCVGDELGLQTPQVGHRQAEPLVGSELRADAAAGLVQARVTQQVANHLERKRHVDVRLHLLPARDAPQRPDVAAVDGRRGLAAQRHHERHRAHLVLVLGAAEAAEVGEVAALGDEQPRQAMHLHERPRPLEALRQLAAIYRRRRRSKHVRTTHARTHR